MIKNTILKEVTERILSKNHPKLIKAQNSLFKVFFYGFISIYGYSVLSRESWSGNIHEYYTTFGTSFYPCKISIYYLVEFSYYLTEVQYLIIQYFYKDRVELITHHFITLVLISLSYYKDFVRIGVIVMALHDVSDPFLESAKIFIYMEKKKLANIGFIIFTVVFVVSRIFLYPYFILYPVVYYFWGNFYCTQTIICTFCLIILYFLHIYWTILIFKTIKKFVIDKEIRDTRSESHLDTSE
ncbi:hypothetical protein P3W45_000476 [Vairimorpha bombi]